MNEAISLIPKAETMRSSDEERIALSISERNTDELIIALIGPVGSGVTTTSMCIRDILVGEFKYDAGIIDVSGDVLAKSASLVGMEAPSNDVLPAERVRILQSIGSELRRRISVSFVAEKCVEIIAIQRHDTESYHGSDEEHAKRRRHVYIIDSLKHPSEIQLLRDVYGDAFWVVGVLAPEDVRKQRLVSKGLDEVTLAEIMIRDQDEGLPYGQRVAKGMHLADFFVRNDAANTDNLRHTLLRYFDILFNTSVHTPTPEETAMYSAASAAASSACLSRQVGAAIYSSTGELLAVGANDVPKGGGGLYTTADGALDNRCFKWNGRYCHNDSHKAQIYAEIAKNLRAQGLVPKSHSDQEIVDLLKETRIRDLIEFSRAVHAEMDAIISAARSGKEGLVDSTLYTTTFPCHSCARHIVAAGISRVIYIEPYQKSLALTLHRDSITTVESGAGKEVRFLQFNGVAPKNIVKLFSHKGERKKDGGGVREILRKDAKPVFPVPLDGFSFREKIVVDNLKKSQEAVAEAPKAFLHETANRTGPDELPLGPSIA